MKEALLIARRLTRLARILLATASRSRCFEDDDYAEWTKKARFAESLWKRHFAGAVDGDGRVRDGIARKSFSFDASEIGCEEGREVKVEAAVLELRDGDDEWNRQIRKQYYPWMEKAYSSGQGDSQYDPATNTIRVAVYGGNLDNELAMDRDAMMDTFVHEMLHGFDNVEERFPDDDDYGRKYDDVPEEENNGVPYPGMPSKWGRLENTDPHYGQYYSCRAERREYAYSLTTFISRYARRSGKTVDETCKMLDGLIEDRDGFRRWLENADFATDCPLVLYHLAFSDTGNGDADDARRLVELARRYLSGK